MIAPGANVRVYLACGVTDMRKGIDGLMALVQSSLRQKPASGSVFVFRDRRGDRIKLLFWDGQGFCLYYKVLEKGRFPWASWESSMERQRYISHPWHAAFCRAHNRSGRLHERTPARHICHEAC